MRKFTQLPTTLYRLQNSLRFKLKEKQTELQKGKTLYDYVANPQGLYAPRNFLEPQLNNFEPNGMQLFNMSESFKDIIRSTMKGGPRYYYVVEIPQGTPIPQQTVLLQDPIEQHVFWLETQIPCQPRDFNSKMQLLLLQSKIHRKKEFRPLFLIQNKKIDIKGLTDDKDSVEINQIV